MGVGGIAYAGSHGAELLEPGDTHGHRSCRRSTPGPAACASSPPAATTATCACCACGSRTRARSPASTGAARPTRRPRGPGSRASPGGGDAGLRDPLGPQGARDPPAGAGRTRARRRRAGAPLRVRAALYAGDDATDLDAFDALDSSWTRRRSTRRARRGALGRGPAAIVERADLVVDGTDGVAAVLGALAGERALRRLPAAGGAAVRGRGHGVRRRGARRRARANDDDTLICRRGRLVGSRPLSACWMGRRARGQRGHRRGCWPTRAPTPRCRSSSPARCSSTGCGRSAWSPSVAGGARLLVPAGAGDRDRLHAAGGARCGGARPSAVQAIEERDGVRFYVERSSPFKPTRLMRTPGLRKNEPVAGRRSAHLGLRALAQRVELRPRARVRDGVLRQPGPPRGGHAVARCSPASWSQCASESITSVAPSLHGARVRSARSGRGGRGCR